MAQAAPPVGGLRSSLYDPLQPGDVELYFTEERIGLVSLSPSLPPTLALPLFLLSECITAWCVSTLGADGD